VGKELARGAGQELDKGRFQIVPARSWERTGVTMSVEYTNRKGKRHFLHVGKTKKGAVHYHFSTKSSGDVAPEMPEGYEVYEHPNGRVFLRKIEPQLISDEEIRVIDRALREHGDPNDYKIDTWRDVITVFRSNRIARPLKDLPPIFAFAAVQELIEKNWTYTPVLRFVLVDTRNRLFITERFCFRTSVDDWIGIGGPDSLENQAARFINHLGKASFYELI
jgi:hypothetical protein